MGRFLEFGLVRVELDDPYLPNDTYYYRQSFLMRDERYVVLSRYWNDIIVTGVFPILGLTCLNLSIYRKIRNSNKFRQLHDKSCRPSPRSAVLATSNVAMSTQVGKC